MRFSLAAASCVVLAALFAGCNVSQGTSTLPSSGTGVGAPQVSHGGGGPLFRGGPVQYPKGPVTTEQLMKWQAAGHMPSTFGYTKDQILRNLHALQYAKAHPQKKRQPAPGKPALWALETYYDELQGISKTGADVGSPVDTYTANGCYPTQGLKVDKKGNLVVPCSEIYSDYTYTYTDVDVFKKNGSYSKDYTGGCPANIYGCYYWYGYPIDVGFSKTDVFASLEFYEYSVPCGYSYCYYSGTGFYYWPIGGGQGKLIPVSLNGWDIFEMTWMDVDAQGNLWAFAAAEETSYPYTYGTGVIEVQNPTGGTPTVSNPIAFGSLPGQYYWGMVYASNKGKVLNVEDAYNQLTYRWSLPGMTSMSSLGPVGNAYGPWVGGFSKGSKSLALIDSESSYYDQLDFIKVAGNVGSTKTTTLYYPLALGWAKSDKTTSI